MRGVLHTWTAPAIAAAGVIYLWLAESTRARVGVAVWAVAATALFSVSATYHRGGWRPTVKAWLQRLDHSMIFLMIAGSYTPICLAVLHGERAAWLLAVVWGGALFGIATRLLWHTAPRWLFVPMYIALGWVALAIMPDLMAHAPAATSWLLFIGGVLYTLGALVFATKWPDPWPRHFGFHEVFHAMTVLAASAHAAAIALVVL